MLRVDDTFVVWKLDRLGRSGKQLAEMERELIVEHTRAGLDVVRQLGRKSWTQAEDDAPTRALPAAAIASVP